MELYEVKSAYIFMKDKLNSLTPKKSEDYYDIKNYYSYLVAGFNYYFVLHSKGIHEVGQSLLQEIKHTIENCPVKITSDFNTSTFLHNNDDFGKMKSGVE